MEHSYASHTPRSVSPIALRAQHKLLCMTMGVTFGSKAASSRACGGTCSLCHRVCVCTHLLLHASTRGKSESRFSPFSLVGELTCSPSLVLRGTCLFPSPACQHVVLWLSQPLRHDFCRGPTNTLNRLELQPHSSHSIKDARI